MGRPTTFNTLLREVGIDPKEVRILRHQQGVHHGQTLFEFRRDNPNGFLAYQCVQSAKPRFQTSTYWASFTVSPSGNVLFAGLYRVERKRRADADDIDPFRREIHGHTNGVSDGKEYDFYQTDLCDELSEQIDHLEIEWDKGYVNWCRYAGKKDFPVKTDTLVQLSKYVDQFDLAHEPSEEVESRETVSKPFIRDPKVRTASLRRAGGQCEHCGEAGFTMTDGRIYLETHHIISLADGGPDHISNVIALCPNHHREAHYGSDAEKLKVVFTKRVATNSAR